MLARAQFPRCPSHDSEVVVIWGEHILHPATTIQFCLLATQPFFAPFHARTAMALNWEKSWIWHPDWVETPASSSAGAFLHFRKSVVLDALPTQPTKIAITADTRYKLYINSRLIHAGPVKGDQQAWFYDVLDIQPHLRVGENTLVVHVLRFYHASQFASSFPRCPYPGLYIKHEGESEVDVKTDDTWQTAIDPCRVLPTTGNLDFFLQMFENVDQREAHQLKWVAAKPYTFVDGFGLSMPWNLTPRMIPLHKLAPAKIKAIHNVKSAQPNEHWQSLLGPDASTIVLPKGTEHHIEIEVDQHTTGYVTFRFARPSTAGAVLNVTWSEGYEDEPVSLPFARRKGDRADSTKQILGPKDQYIFGGPLTTETLLNHDEAETDDECFAPFHYRTLRVIALDITVPADSDLVLKGVEIVKTNYPLEVTAAFHQVDPAVGDSKWFHDLWRVSLCTITNCMHDCYEDCPFYEQLQYAMDTRSSALFTYQISRDDRLARQAITQLYNSFQPAVGLTAGRAPSHHLQFISHFSLFWVCMVTDHYEHFGDASFTAKFLPVINAVLNTFYRRLDTTTGLLRVSDVKSDWEFVDWSEYYHPLGIPPAGTDTGFLTYTNQLYAYTLQRLSLVETCLAQPAQATEHSARAASIVKAIQTHCFDGEYYTDGLAALAQPTHYSENSQIWSVLCGAISGPDATALLKRSLVRKPETDATSSTTTPRKLTTVSIAMAFYSLRALSAVDETTYNAHFYDFWEPWRHQVSLNMTTWLEDYITQRSDCHAWGSLPLYEFTAEVAGFKPVMSGGERQLVFRPRVGLFKTFEAEVPVGGEVGKLVTARVRWEAGEDGVVDVELAWSGDVDAVREGGLLPVRAELPGGQTDTVKMFEGKKWQVKV
ncbi:Six-hairpin glycosidase [Aspergillus varians]